MKMGDLSRLIQGRFNSFTHVKKRVQFQLFGDIIISSKINCQSLPPLAFKPKDPKFEGLVKLLSVYFNKVRFSYCFSNLNMRVNRLWILVKRQILIP